MSNIREILERDFPNQMEIRFKDIREAVEREMEVSSPTIYRMLAEDGIEKVRHGWYSLALNTPSVAENVVPMPVSSNNLPAVSESFDIKVPNKIPEFVVFGGYSDVRKVIETGMFFPVYISGMSGNGKTMMVEQACAVAKRKFLRVQISPETDEIDLVGGFRLQDGNTVFEKGPVIRAMEEGAILLIDEIDRSSHNLIVLNGILEGKPYLIKKTGETIYPKEGFNIIATANTLGRGSDDGMFAASIVMDEALLERFAMTINQSYPTPAVERRLLMRHVETFGYNVPEDFVSNLVNWAEVIRKTYYDGGVDNLVTTRRLTHILQIYNVFQNVNKAINYGVSRFDEDTASAFVTLYKNIDKTFEEERESYSE